MNTNFLDPVTGAGRNSSASLSKRKEAQRYQQQRERGGRVGNCCCAHLELVASGAGCGEGRAWATWTGRPEVRAGIHAIEEVIHAWDCKRVWRRVVRPKPNRSECDHPTAHNRAVQSSIPEIIIHVQGA